MGLKKYDNTNADDTQFVSDIKAHSKEALIKLMRENIGEGKSAKDKIQSFNGIPQDGVEQRAYFHTTH